MGKPCKRTKFTSPVWKNERATHRVNARNFSPQIVARTMSRQEALTTLLHASRGCQDMPHSPLPPKTLHPSPVPRPIAGPAVGRGCSGSPGQAERSPAATGGLRGRAGGSRSTHRGGGQAADALAQRVQVDPAAARSAASTGAGRGGGGAGGGDGDGCGCQGRIGGAGGAAAAVPAKAGQGTLALLLGAGLRAVGAQRAEGLGGDLAAGHGAAGHRGSAQRGGQPRRAAAPSRGAPGAAASHGRGVPPVGGAPGPG